MWYGSGPILVNVQFQVVTDHLNRESVRCYASAFPDRRYRIDVVDNARIVPR